MCLKIDLIETRKQKKKFSKTKERFFYKLVILRITKIDEGVYVYNINTPYQKEEIRIDRRKDSSLFLDSYRSNRMSQEEEISGRFTIGIHVFRSANELGFMPNSKQIEELLFLDLERTDKDAVVYAYLRVKGDRDSFIAAGERNDAVFVYIEIPRSQIKALSRIVKNAIRRKITQDNLKKKETN